MKKKDWKKSKTIFWKDELHDDFDEVGLSRPPVPENYHYKRTNVINNFFSGILYHGIAKPVLGTYCFFKGIKVKGKRNLKELHGKGAYIYANHTAISDVFKYQAYAFFLRKRVNILGYSDTLNLPVVRNITRALGYLPVPLEGDMKNLIALSNACDFYINKKQFVLIYPEAHIWPYYTKIRNFSAGSFIYPAKFNTPIIPSVTTYRHVWYSKKPRQTIFIGKPIYPDSSLSLSDSKLQLHDACLKAMNEMSNRYKQQEYLKYIHVEKE